MSRLPPEFLGENGSTTHYFSGLQPHKAIGGRKFRIWSATDPSHHRRVEKRKYIFFDFEIETSSKSSFEEFDPGSE